MTDNVVEMADYRPHLMVVGKSSVHVVPCALIQAVIDGNEAVSSIDTELARDILADWLKTVTAERDDGK
jgi:hypothetical protein